MASHASEPKQPSFGSRHWRYLSIVAIVLGALFIGTASVYTYWILRSGSDADKFDISFSQDVRDQITGQNAASVQLDEDLVASNYVSLYPGGRINPRYWSDPDWAGSLPFGAPNIPADFTPVSSRDPVAAAEAGNPATRIRIPSIDLDSAIAELQILDLGDQRAYQTPNNIVGHIPETANPGLMNNGWFFGHLESLGTGEGNVFNRVPEIAELLRHDPVDIFIETDDAEYMYRVTSTRQVHESDLKLTTTDNAQITLCTCWPPKVYDRRVLVSAELIAVKRL